MSAPRRPRPASQLTRDNSRAKRLRAKARAGTITDIERQWLAKYAIDSKARNHKPKPPPTIALTKILDEVVRRYRVSARAIRTRNHGFPKLDVLLARAVAVCAMRKVGATLDRIGEVMNLYRNRAHVILRRDGRAPAVQREAEAVIQAVIPRRRGDLVWVTARVVVGDSLWIALDRAAEAAEVSEASIAHRTARDRLRDAE